MVFDQHVLDTLAHLCISFYQRCHHFKVVIMLVLVLMIMMLIAMMVMMILVRMLAMMAMMLMKCQPRYLVESQEAPSPRTVGKRTGTKIIFRNIYIDIMIDIAMMIDWMTAMTRLKQIITTTITFARTNRIDDDDFS